MTRSVPGARVASWPADPTLSPAEEAEVVALLASREEDVIGSGTMALSALEQELNAKTPTWLDKRSLDDYGLKPTEQVTILAVDDRLTLAARLLNALEPIDCTILLRRGIIVITSTETAEENPVTRVYDVTPLVDSDRPSAGPHDWRAEPTLVRCLESHVQPDTWDTVGGNSTASLWSLSQRTLLIVSTTTVTHFEVEAFLNGLNKVSSFGTERLSPAQQAVQTRSFSRGGFFSVPLPAGGGM